MILAAPDRGTVRAAVLTGFPEVMRQLGGDPVELLLRVGFETRALVEPDMQLDAVRVNRLLELAALETGCEDLGLRIARMRGITTLGPIGILAREEPDVAAALKTLVDYMFLHNRAASMRVEPAGEYAVLAIWLDFGEPVTMRQSTEMMLGGAVNALRTFLGRDWNPVQVQLVHSAPRQADSHRRFFRAPISYGQPLNSLTLRAADLRAPMQSASPEFERQVRGWVEAMADAARSEHAFAADLRRLVQMLLPSGKCSADRVARYYGMDRRTVHRRLARSGLSFAVIVNEVRRELAQRQVGDARVALSEVADMLGFTHASAFTRWFTAEFGDSPTRWRQAHR